MIAKNIPKLITDTKPQIQDEQKISGMMNPQIIYSWEYDI
jgi:hypothetical protein